MKLALIFLIFIAVKCITINALGQAISAAKKDSSKAKPIADTIQWSPDNKLTYSDFQETEYNPKDILYDGVLPKGDTAFVFGAYSRLSIGWSFKTIDQKRIIEAMAVFYRSKSWIQLRELNTLIHEQGHFDIAELYAREFKKRMEAYQDIKDPKLFWEIFYREFNDIDKQHWKEQKEYDAIWQGGSLNQRFYLEKIARRLQTPE